MKRNYDLLGWSQLPASEVDPDEVAEHASGAVWPLRAVLDLFTAAIWVLDDERRVHVMNAAARNCTARNEGFGLRQKRLYSTDFEASERLTRAVRKVCARPGSQDTFYVHCPRAVERLWVVVRPLPTDPDIEAGAMQRVLVMATRAH